MITGTTTASRLVKGDTATINANQKPVRIEQVAMSENWDSVTVRYWDDRLIVKTYLSPNKVVILHEDRAY